jgi:hypothetical protein
MAEITRRIAGHPPGGYGNVKGRVQVLADELFDAMSSHGVVAPLKYRQPELTVEDAYRYRHTRCSVA